MCWYVLVREICGGKTPQSSGVDHVSWPCVPPDTGSCLRSLSNTLALKMHLWDAIFEKQLSKLIHRHLIFQVDVHILHLGVSF